MSKSNSFENSILKLILWGTTIAGIADNTAASPKTSLYLALHTADPGEAGSAITSEASYTSYARVPVARSAAGFAITANVATLVADAAFPTSTGGSTSAITHASLVDTSTGAGVILYSNALDAPITMASGIQPVLDTGTSITED